MNTRVARSLFLMLFTLVGFLGAQASAEGFLQFSLGAALTEDSDFEFDGFGVIPDVEFDDSVSVDLTGGAWFSPIDFVDIGVAGSLGYSGPSVDTAAGFDDLDFHLLPLSILGMVRVPLFQSEELPHGLLQPYAGIGPQLLLSVIDVDGAGVDGTAVGFDIGFDVRAGVNLNLTRRISLFAQYKRTQVDASLSDSSDDLEIDFETDHITGGIGIHF